MAARGRDLLQPQELRAACRREGFTPRITAHSDDIVVVQSLVAAGIGVATQPGLALRAHHRPDVHATVIPGCDRRVYAATYGDPPDPPAVTAVLAALTEAAGSQGHDLRDGGNRPYCD